MAADRNTPATPSKSGDVVAPGIVTEEVSKIESADVEPESEEVVNYRKVDGIRYLGTANVKQYSKDDLQKLGFENAESGVEWSASNDFFVSKSEFNAAALRAIVAQDDFEAV
jgi:hypothetical protein